MVVFEPNKIAVALMKAFLAVHGTQGAASASVRETVDTLTEAVVRALLRSRPGGGTFHIEDIQDSVELGLHLHDTRGLALANATAGLDAGVRRFDASIGGLGGCPFSPGATGNVCTEDLVHLFHALGLSTGIDLDELISVASTVEHHLGTELPSRMLRAGPRFARLAT